MPTGVHIAEPRQALFDAAERVLLRDGPDALTSRAVTEEASFAKGVLHRHFSDFEDFLAALVADRAERIDAQAAALRALAGNGTVAANLVEVLTALFSSVAVAIIPLIVFRSGLLARLRQMRTAGGVPVLAEATTMISSYLAEECTLGRISVDADVDSLAVSLVGAAHLLFAGRGGVPPTAGELDRAVAAVIADVIQRRPL
ncbi:MAG: TetR/AcrR family transcriptional regulator [Acidimicrobiales bacterium]